jgi:hypothetical protein
MKHIICVVRFLREIKVSFTCNTELIFSLPQKLKSGSIDSSDHKLSTILTNPSCDIATHKFNNERRCPTTPCLSSEVAGELFGLVLRAAISYKIFVGMKLSLWSY